MMYNYHFLYVLSSFHSMSFQNMSIFYYKMLLYNYIMYGILLLCVMFYGYISDGGRPPLFFALCNIHKCVYCVKVILAKEGRRIVFQCV